MNSRALLSRALAALRAELGDDSALASLPAGEAASLAAAAGGDAARLKRWLKRLLAGEPLAYITGRFTFRGLEFAVDKRAYITDPELTHLVTAVLARVRLLRAAGRRAPLLAEIGVGCGSLAIAIRRKLPAARLVGLDLDPDALAVARRNAAAHGLALTLIESDLFDSWPASLRAPDLIYGDPPWGDATTLYDGGPRDAGHYDAMPPASAFPLGGRTGSHTQILHAVARRGWSSEIWLNGGVLPPAELTALARDAGAVELAVTSPFPNLSLLRCRMLPAIRGTLRAYRRTAGQHPALPTPNTFGDLPSVPTSAPASGALNAINKSAWDQLYASTKEPVWGRAPVGFLARYLPAADILPPGQVLDAAAGEGRNLPPLLALGRLVTACDASACALGKINPSIRSRVTRLECDLAELPLRDSLFALVLLCDVVETLPEPAEVLGELRRVLVPGGLLLVNIPGDDDGVSGIEMEPAPDGGWLYRGRYYYHFYSKAEAETLLVGAGFEIITSQVSSWEEAPHPQFRPEPHTHRSLIITARRPAS